MIALAPLRESLEEGDEFATGGRTITETDVVSFSALTADWHPQHSDAAWASDSMFGERIAHGMLVLSYAIGLLDFPPDRVVAMRGLRKVTFKRPARIGETISVRGHVASKRPVGEGLALARLAVDVVGVDGKSLVTGEIEALTRAEEES